MARESWARSAKKMVDTFNATIIPLGQGRTPVFKYSKADERTPAHLAPSKNPDIIEKWAKKYPTYGVLALENLYILDIDVKDEQNGLASLSAMFEAGLPSDVFTVQSPSGGLHLYFNPPSHYAPRQGAGLDVRSTVEGFNEKWVDLQKLDSTGVDIRFGNGYVVGPGCKTDKGGYDVIVVAGLGEIPESMRIGGTASVKIEPVKRPETLGSAVKTGSRNQAMLTYTMELSRNSRMTEGEAASCIKTRLADMDNSDGEAPTFEEAWSQYERAMEKEGDEVRDLIDNFVFIVEGSKVLNIGTGISRPLVEMETQYSNKSVYITIETASGEIKTKRMNPVKVWLEDLDRVTVESLIYNPTMEHGVVEIPHGDPIIAPGLYFNTYTPVERQDGLLRTDKGEEMFRALRTVIENVFDNEVDRQWFYKWLAVGIFDPSYRPAWSIHLFSSTRGIGKTMVSDFINTIVGRGNGVSFDSEVFTDSFNGELFTAMFGLLNDFTPVSHGKGSKVLARFKSISTANYMSMNEKFQSKSQRPLFIRFFMTSNSYGDFPVDVGDRRVYKVESQGVSLDASIYLMAASITSRTNHGSKDALWAMELMYRSLEKCGWEDMYTQTDCPRNDLKLEHKETAMSKLELQIREAIDHHVHIFKSDIITLSMLQLYLDHIQVKTKVATVMTQLVEAGVICKLKVQPKNVGDRLLRRQVTLPFIMYDKDLDAVTQSGKSKKVSAFTCRNAMKWTDETGRGAFVQHVNANLFRDRFLNGPVEDISAPT